ncbi:TerB family tellurite resistance protein [Modicisalibacter xianhensis]|uniref:Uncharacterized conserved protein, tellurite resistance protein B (TerB) family n=1 Tax=Modicisalibacter xianhensis TaxID=442341 RepID=A0A1I3ABB7_9GAMM|nr:TerB family tellurite resistance protein [Halomonas xianhensis]SFH47402.1 Uncharacterized conserved protein, tellurite resistance protein B (TerB) family [Halomonas xianhensis]
MLDAIQQFFTRTLAPQDDANRALTLELATAALLCEVVRADYQTEPQELDTLRDMLQSRFSLNRAAVDELMELAAAEADQAVDHFQFVRLVNEHYDYVDKVELVELMWRLAYADEQLDALEEHRIRKLADLLFVRHSDFIRTKLRVQEGRGGAQT